MLAAVLTFGLMFLVITLFGYGVHKALHQKWTGRYYKSHMTHHVKLYPLSDFTSEVYRSPGKDNTAKFFIIAGIPLIIAPILLFALHVIALPVFIAAMLGLAVFGGLNDYLHDSFHITDHWLNRFGWFRKMIERHKVHHKHMQRNMGIYWFGWDRVFKTFKKGNTI